MEGTHIWVGEYGSPATPGAWSGNSSMTSDLGALLTLSGLPLGVGLLGGGLSCAPLEKLGIGGALPPGKLPSDLDWGPKGLSGTVPPSSSDRVWTSPFTFTPRAGNGAPKVAF